MDTTLEQTENTIKLMEYVSDMAKEPTKKPKTPKRRRVTFYIHPEGGKRRKKVSFLVRR